MLLFAIGCFLFAFLLLAIALTVPAVRKPLAVLILAFLLLLNGVALAEIVLAFWDFLGTLGLLLFLMGIITILYFFFRTTHIVITTGRLDEAVAFLASSITFLLLYELMLFFTALTLAVIVFLLGQDVMPLVPALLLTVASLMMTLCIWATTARAGQAGR